MNLVVTVLALQYWRSNNEFFWDNNDGKTNSRIYDQLCNRKKGI